MIDRVIYIDIPPVLIRPPFLVQAETIVYHLSVRLRVLYRTRERKTPKWEAKASHEGGPYLTRRPIRL